MTAITELVGKTIKSIEGLECGSKNVRIFTECGKQYRFYHEQDCCEDVELYDYDGDECDLIGALIISAEEASSENGDPKPNQEYSDSWTWTFYKIETNRSGLWMRWLGESNGYYSESVDFVRAGE